MPHIENHPQERIIFFHKHGTSARTRFLRFSSDTVCGFTPLPRLAQLSDVTQKPVVSSHPAKLINEAASRLNIPAAGLEWEPEYNIWVDIPGGPCRILLFRFVDIDPPFSAVEAQGGRFIDLTQARDLSEVELLLLRHAYEVILGG